ncbi:unnamed protein product [Thelazia callipaeda]|uniref:Uncharacterized protein n=1 Tax=Thelazia callipaeda TaxID=103827 RepID=A0A0N5D2E6_THECL|nr:unnamed protein product [Thelazia callipaeda]
MGIIARQGRQDFFLPSYLPLTLEYEQELIDNEKIMHNRTINYGLNCEEAMFDFNEGSEEELLNKKCESIDLKRPQETFFVIGFFDISTKKQSDFEVGYWKDYRLLRNRRDIFVLKKSINAPLEHLRGLLDCRLIKQLIFGMLDSPLSLFNRTHYLPGFFTRIMRTNLREKSVLVKNRNGNIQWASLCGKTQFSSMEARTEFPLEMWHFLNFRSFFDASKHANAKTDE